MKDIDYQIYKRYLCFVFPLALLFILGISACKKEDTTGPLIQLSGSDTLYLNLNDNWLEPGFAATDNKDGDLTAQVIVTGQVDTRIVNLYTVEYRVNDQAGNETVKNRTVFVKADSLQGVYHVDATVEGTTQGNYSYSVIVIPGEKYNLLKIKNFADFGSQVTLDLLIQGNVILMNPQSPAGVNPGYEGTISGTGSYDGLNKRIVQLQYTLNYLNGGTDTGTTVFTKN